MSDSGPSDVLAERISLLLFGKSARRAPAREAQQASALHVDWSSRLREHWPPLCFAICAAYSLAASLIGWMNPLLDAHGFRQTQTAMSVWTMLNGGPLVAYETPVMGPPWSMPYEFPLFQWIVAAVVQVSHVGLDQAGRFVSLAMFWLALVPGYYALSAFGLMRNQRWLILSLVVVSPFYIFWSRTFMIESTALCLSLAFVATAESFLRTGRRGTAIAAAVFGVLAALVKITSFVVYLEAFALILLCRRLQDRANARGWLRDGLSLLVCGAACLGPAIAWTHYADSLKVQNPIAAFTTSTALENWNFGSLEDRFSWATWSRILNSPGRRDYHPAFFAAAAAGALLARRRWKQIGICVLIYFSAPLVFTNLYRVHWYYCYPNLLFLLVAVGLAIVGLLEQADWRKYAGMALFFSAIAFSVHRHWTVHTEMQARDHWNILAEAAAIDRVSAADEIVIIYGHEWSPEIPYYARRRALMLPSFITSEAAAQEFASLAGYKVGAMLVVVDPRAAHGWYPPNAEQVLHEQARHFGLSAIPSYASEKFEVFPPLRYEQAYQNRHIAIKQQALGAFHAAESALSSAIHDQPHDPTLFAQRAICRLSQGQLREALADYDAAERLGFVESAFYVKQAAALLEAYRQAQAAGQNESRLLDRALRSADRAIAMDATQRGFFQLRSQVHLARGERELAEQDRRQAESLKK